MRIYGKSDVQDAITKHIDNIDGEINSLYSGEKTIGARAELFAAKSEALKALALLYKDRI